MIIHTFKWTQLNTIWHPFTRPFVHPSQRVYRAYLSIVGDWVHPILNCSQKKKIKFFKLEKMIGFLWMINVTILTSAPRHAIEKRRYSVQIYSTQRHLISDLSNDDTQNVKWYFKNRPSVEDFLLLHDFQFNFEHILF